MRQNLETAQPAHEWTIEKLDKMMIKTDDPFLLDDFVWKLGITYNRTKEPILNVNINTVVNPF
jgi:hypothetical protein